jgi:flagellar biosynthesis/type III secretory pathway protein FliH
MEAVVPKEKKVLFWTVWHDRGFDEGLDKGREEGLEQGRSEARERAARSVRRMWWRHFGAEPPESVRNAADTLDADRLEELSDAILDFETPDAADAWLSQHTS